MVVMNLNNHNEETMQQQQIKNAFNRYKLEGSILMELNKAKNGAIMLEKQENHAETRSYCQINVMIKHDKLSS
jgi:hypothetical protein